MRFISMKYLIFSCLILATFSSCTKSNDTPPPPDTDSLLKSFSVYNPQLHGKVTEVYGYDENSAIAYIHGYSDDSSESTPQHDSTFIQFSTAGANALPDAYDITYYEQGGQPAGYREHHILSYDGQSRVILDSATTSETGGFTSQHFSYDDMGNTTLESYSGNPQTPGSYSLFQIDTMNIQENNMFTDIAYNAPGSGLIHLITRSFSTDISPVFHESFSPALGCLFSFNSLIDFRSKNVPSHMTYQDDNSQYVTLDFVWSSDSAGRVVQGIGTDPNSGLAGEIYQFNY